MRAEVEAMLAAQDASGEDRLGQAVEGALAWDGDDTVSKGAVPERLGPYRLVKEIGRGGLATVYLAERDDAEFYKRVAIKLVRRGLDTDDILERLRLERQILAHLDHPNVARLFDGGTAEDGRPYFVMEAIEGERIDLWCERRRLPLGERLELFRQVCAAVDYAHRNLVLHRDIKPSNLLVTPEGVPKLLDFGIAKVLSSGVAGERLDTPTLTRAGDRLLTPEFASPEQLRGEPLSTASDVYSLGVLLYLLVTGRRPYEVDRRRLSEVERMVSEVWPEAPSTVVRRARRDGEEVPEGWPGTGRAEDLDNVVLMALAKEPGRRYASAGQLAEDLRRFLADEPVAARRDTLTYRARKFVRRHRLAVAAAALVLVSLLGAVVLTTWQAGVARAERGRAEAERRRAEEVAAFLVDLFAGSDPQHSLGETVTARMILDEGARRIRAELGDSPVLKAEMMTTMGVAYQNLALFAEADELLEEVVAIRRQSGHPAELAASLRDLGFLRHNEEAYDEAETILEEALRIQEGVPGIEAAERSRTLHYLARVKAKRGDFEAAEELFERALEGYRPAGGPALFETLDSYAQMWADRQHLERAEEILRRVYEERRRLWGDDRPEVAESLNNLAVTLSEAGRVEEAEELYRQAVELNRRIFGPRHPVVALNLYNVALALEGQEGRTDEARALLEDALAIDREVFGDEHTAVARDLHALARVAHVAGELAEARRLVEHALEIDRRALGEGHPRVLRHRFKLAELARASGDPDTRSLYLELVEVMRRSLPDDYRLAFPLRSLGLLHLEEGDAAGAEVYLREALEVRRSTLSEGDPLIAESEADLDRCLAVLGRR